jgi:hypothetical protein
LRRKAHGTPPTDASQIMSYKGVEKLKSDDIADIFHALTTKPKL